MYKAIGVLLALILALIPNVGRAGGNYLVDPTEIDSTDPSSWAWLVYNPSPQGATVSLKAVAYGWLPIDGIITAERLGSPGSVFRSGFEDGEDAGNTSPVALLDSSIDRTWWYRIPGQGSSDYQTERAIATGVTSGRYRFRVFFTDDDDEYTDAIFVFDIP